MYKRQHLDSIYMELFRFNRLKSSAKCVIIVTIQKGKGSAGWFPAEKGNKKMEYKIALIPGDGIGPEIVREARKVLDAVCSLSLIHISGSLLRFLPGVCVLR